MIISVIIPTHSRPGLLEEAVRSVFSQSYKNWELVIIDDGSIPPVDRQKLESIAGRKISFLRRDNARGVVASKNAGLELAKGEVILFLDDDDLLAPNALDVIARAFGDNPDLDCVFMNIETFGKCAQGSARNQTEAMARLLARAKTAEVGNLLIFDSTLVDALLRSVPLAFQRPALRASLSRKIGPMPDNLIFAEPEWTILAAMFGKVALTKQAISKWRVDGQNFASKPEMALKQMQRSLMAREWLLKFVKDRNAELSVYLPLVKKALSMTYQDVSLYMASQSRMVDAIGYGLKSCCINPTLSKVKLLLFSVPYRLLHGYVRKSR